MQQINAKRRPGPAPEESLPCVCSVKINIEHYNLNELALIQKCLFR